MLLPQFFFVYRMLPPTYRWHSIWKFKPWWKCCCQQEYKHKYISCIIKQLFNYEFTGWLNLHVLPSRDLNFKYHLYVPRDTCCLNWSCIEIGWRNISFWGEQCWEHSLPTQSGRPGFDSGQVSYESWVFVWFSFIIISDSDS